MGTASVTMHVRSIRFADSPHPTDASISSSVRERKIMNHFGVPSIIAVVINYVKEERHEGLSSSHIFAGRFGRSGLRSYGA
jgi:hypothetical protein